MSKVNTNMFATAGVDLALAGQRPGLLTLPLNIIAVLVAHLDNVADLARLCRTCRVLNYMALPQLYKDLTLTSYDKFRYRDEFVEGWGSGSPFSIALNAVVTRNVGGLVRSLTLRGEWRENELEEHARVGRVPDSSMMLNIVVRAAVDKMPGLESVSWELNTKMLQTVYQGLAQLPRLKSLTVRFPSSRHPRPTIVIPAMPHLRALKITDIDPLCYPDDLSTLLYQSKKLRELRLHWSPRMQEAQEASVNFTDYFRKCIAAKSPVKLKKVAFQNLYSLHREEIMSGIDYSGLEDLTVFTAPFDTMSFVENSWPMPNWVLNLKSIRFDRLEKRSCELLGNLEGLEKFYLVTGIRSPGDYRNSPKHFSLESSTILTPDSSPAGRRRSASANDRTPSSISNIDNFIPQASPTVLNFPLHVRDPLFQVITSGLGSTLRHLLLPSRWTLPPHLIARLPPEINARSIAEVVDMDDCIHNEVMGVSLADMEIFGTLKIIGLGWKAWELGALYTIPASKATQAFLLRDENAIALKYHSAPDDLSDDQLVEMRFSIPESIQRHRQASLNTWPTTSSPRGKRKRRSYSSDLNGDSSINNHSPVPNPNNHQNTLSSPSLPTTSTSTTNPNQQIPPSPSRASSVSTMTTTATSPSTEPQAQVPGHSPNPPPISAKPSLTQPPIQQTPPPSQSGHTLTFPCGDKPMSKSNDTMRDVIQCINFKGLSGGGDVLYRRRVKRVGWEVLKHWEIWGLDVQEI
ncbi:conserved hypothetical protein [Histoplasma mississippiense (nom. inval.)]|uniref:conserved hypothetical protein n=1 Tax=Ajellomyces capsulatus (strain NAm1 / WU24) TaxID=2059318 RepID=UPI000157BC4D|nr:conserved hypothetical protein [Histoplasma mississippiense (nom. inval.)]EDN05875.1 conserved hypothetical protein [Histoplasma mississippiense (nom. inval.)]